MSGRPLPVPGTCRLCFNSYTVLYEYRYTCTGIRVQLRYVYNNVYIRLIKIKIRQRPPGQLTSVRKPCLPAVTPSTMLYNCIPYCTCTRYHHSVRYWYPLPVSLNSIYRGILVDMPESTSAACSGVSSTITRGPTLVIAARRAKKRKKVRYSYRYSYTVGISRSAPPSDHAAHTSFDP